MSDKKKTSPPNDQDFLVDVLNDLPTLIDRWLPDGTITYINDNCCNYFGMRREDILGKSYFSFLHKDELARLKECLSKLTREDPIGIFIQSWTSPEGETKWQRWANKAIFDDNGALTCYQSTGCDITSEKAIDTALTESEEKFKAIFDTSIDGIAIADFETRKFHSCNASFTNMLGYTTKELTALRIENIHPPDSNVLEIFAKLIKDKATFDKNIPVLRKDGSIFYADINASVLELDGRFYALGSFRDTSERREAEDAIIAVEETYRSIFHNSQVGMVRTRITDGKFLELNDRMVEMFGYDDRDDFVNTYSAIKSYADIKERDRLFKELKDNGFVESFVTSAVRKDGSIFWVEFSARMNKEKGYLDCVVLDVDLKKEAEEAIAVAKERYKDIFTNSQVGMARTRISDGVFLEFNDRIVDMFGYDNRDEFASEYTAEMAYPNPKKRKEFIEKLNKDGVVENFVTEAKRMDGSKIWLEFSARLDKENGYIDSVGVDITEKKLAEEALRSSESKYKTLLENLPQNIFLKDKDSTYVSCNETYAKDLKISTDEIVGKTDYDFFPKELAEKYRADDKKILASGQPEDIVESYIQDGKETVVQTIKIPIFDDESNVTSLLGMFWDITEKKHVEDNLKAEREKLYSILDCFPGFVYLQAPDYSIRFANRRFIDHYGEPDGKLCYELMWKRKKPCEECPTFDVFETNEAVEWISDHTKDDGLYYQVFDYPFTDTDGSPLVLEVSLDITDTVTSSNALKESETRYRMIHSTAMDGIIIADSVGRIVECNPSAEALFGYDKDELVGKYLVEIVPEEYREKHLLGFKRFIDTGKSNIQGSVIELKARKKNGETFDNELVVSSFQLHGETFFTGTIRDITDRKSAQEKHVDQLNFLQTLLDTIPSPIFYKDTEGKYVGCNKAFENALGLSRANIIGKTVFETAPRENADKFSEMDRKLFANPGIQLYEYKMKFKDGLDHNLIVNKATYNRSDGDLAGIVGVMTDITEHKQAEDERENLQEQLVQSQKMQAVGTLAGGIAHDFNNIITVIKTLTELAMKKVAMEDPLQKYLIPISESSNRATNLVQQLLLFSQNKPVEFSIVGINGVVEDLLSMLEHLISEDITIETDLSHDLWKVNADRSRIEQIVTNLFINSSEAMNEGGKVFLRTENITLTKAQCKDIPQSRPGRFVSIIVTDTGTGIDDTDIEHIFEPFFTTKKTMGTGMGLAVVYGIVNEHNGWINVETEAGQGTTFKIFLPMTDEGLLVSTATTRPSSLNVGQGKRILLVEDEKWVRKSTAMVLTDNGYTVFEAANAESAISLFYREKGRFDLVLSDVVMPGRSGLQLVSPLLDINPEIPILLCSGHLDDKSQLSQIAKRGLAFIQKPFEIDELLSAVEETITQGDAV